MIINDEKSRKIREIELEEEQQEASKQTEEAKKNRDFVQVYRNNMPEIGWLSRKNGLATSILFLLMEHMDSKNAVACSYSIFEDYLNAGRTTIYRALKLLEDNGFIGILKMGTSNVYVINHEIAWSSWRNQKKYAKIDGTILISHKENKDYDYKLQVERFKTLRKREKIKVWKQLEEQREEI